ncbi:MAG: tail fiber protein [Deltaproteobacteria bacterium]|nr:tail fiber protein [Deltaproteobacteria bacterium]
MTSLAASKITGVLPVQNGGTGTSNTLVPAGSTIAFAGANVPDGWLLCDGSAVSRTQYAALFSAVGTAWGAGDGSTTFNLPDLRGRFVRGVDSGAGRDPDAAARTAANAGGATGDAVGSVEDDAFAGHNHGVNDPGHAHDYYYSTNSSPPGLPGMDATTFTNSWSPPRISGPILPASTGVSIQTTGGSETRPVNANLNYIIKY